MAIVHDNTTTATGSGSSISFNHTASANATVVILGLNFAGQVINSVTYGGEAMTLAESQGGSRSSVYYLPSPPTGTNTVSVSAGGSDNYSVGATTLEGTDDTSEVIGITGGSTENPGDTASSVTVTTETDNSWIYGHLQHTPGDGGNVTADGANNTERFDIETPDSSSAGATETTTTAGSYTHDFSWTSSASQSYHCAVEIKDKEGEVSKRRVFIID